MDLWIVALLLIGTSSILGAINFLATIFKLRAPGMTLLRMPIFVWTVDGHDVPADLLAMPVFTAGVFMLFIDRNYGGASSTRRRAATPSCGRTCSGSSVTPRSTS